jgi:Phage capsid family
MSDIGLTGQDFGGILVPPQVQAQVINLLVGGAPFANSLTRQPTTRRSVAWPTASPTGWAWLPELGPIPEIDMADNAYIVSVAKIAGLVTLANELVNDAEVNVTNAVSTVLADSLSRDLDLGLLNGAGPPEPAGVIPAAPNVDAADLLTGVSTAMGEIGDAGGTPDTLAVSGATLAAENGRTGPNGLFYPSGFANAVGLKAVVVPALATPLVYDSTRCFLVVNGQESEVAVSNDYAFAKDAQTLRVKARVAAGIPAPAKSIRKLTIAAPGGTTATTAQSQARTK